MFLHNTSYVKHFHITISFVLFSQILHHQQKFDIRKDIIHKEYDIFFLNSYPIDFWAILKIVLAENCSQEGNLIAAA